MSGRGCAKLLEQAFHQLLPLNEHVPERVPLSPGDFTLDLG
jgi:hypothetical protein